MIPFRILHIRFLGLASLPEPVRAKSLGTLLLFLAHRYPKIRRLTAEEMYSWAMIAEDAVREEALEQVMETLADTVWCESLANIIHRYFDHHRTFTTGILRIWMAFALRSILCTRCLMSSCPRRHRNLQCRIETNHR